MRARIRLVQDTSPPMDYAIQILIPILLGIFLGVWLHNEFGASPIWTVVFAIIGMFGGIGILYKRSLQYAEKIKAKTQPLANPSDENPDDENDETHP